MDGGQILVSVRGNTAAQKSAIPPKINYKPHIEDISKRNLSVLPEPLRREAELFFRVAEERGMDRFADDAIKTFEKSSNDYLLYFIRRLTNAIAIGVFDKKETRHLYLKEIKENPAAADAISDFWVKIKKDLGDRIFDELTPGQLYGLTGKTIHSATTFCPNEMQNTFKELANNGELDGISPSIKKVFQNQSPEASFDAPEYTASVLVPTITASDSTSETHSDRTGIRFPDLSSLARTDKFSLLQDKSGVSDYSYESSSDSPGNFGSAIPAAPTESFSASGASPSLKNDCFHDMQQDNSIPLTSAVRATLLLGHGEIISSSGFENTSNSQNSDYGCNTVQYSDNYTKNTLNTSYLVFQDTSTRGDQDIDSDDTCGNRKKQGNSGRKKADIETDTKKERFPIIVAGKWKSAFARTAYSTHKILQTNNKSNEETASGGRGSSVKMRNNRRKRKLLQNAKNQEKVKVQVTKDRRMKKAKAIAKARTDFRDGKKRNRRKLQDDLSNKNKTAKRKKELPKLLKPKMLASKKKQPLNLPSDNLKDKQKKRKITKNPEQSKKSTKEREKLKVFKQVRSKSKPNKTKRTNMPRESQLEKSKHPEKKKTKKELRQSSTKKKTTLPSSKKKYPAKSMADKRRRTRNAKRRIPDVRISPKKRKKKKKVST